MRGKKLTSMWHLIGLKTESKTQPVLSQDLNQRTTYRYREIVREILYIFQQTISRLCVSQKAPTLPFFWNVSVSAKKAPTLPFFLKRECLRNKYIKGCGDLRDIHFIRTGLQFASGRFFQMAHTHTHTYNKRTPRWTTSHQIRDIIRHNLTWKENDHQRMG